MKVKIKEGGQFFKKYERLIEKIRETLENEIHDPKIVEDKIKHFGLKVQKAMKRFRETAENKNHPRQIFAFEKSQESYTYVLFKGKNTKIEITFSFLDNNVVKYIYLSSIDCLPLTEKSIDEQVVADLLDLF